MVQIIDGVGVEPAIPIPVNELVVDPVQNRVAFIGQIKAWSAVENQPIRHDIARFRIIRAEF